MAAPTVANKVIFSVGNLRQVNMLVTLGAASGVVDTGLARIDHVIYSLKSAATAALTVAPNLSSSTTAVYGRLSLNSGASGDDFYITCYGK